MPGKYLYKGTKFSKLNSTSNSNSENKQKLKGCKYLQHWSLWTGILIHMFCVVKAQGRTYSSGFPPGRDRWEKVWHNVTALTADEFDNYAWFTSHDLINIPQYFHYVQLYVTLYLPLDILWSDGSLYDTGALCGWMTHLRLTATAKLHRGHRICSNHISLKN